MENQQTPAIGNLGKIWNGLVAAVGAIVGLIPHILHHVGLFAGTALFAGATGAVFFGIIGFVMTIPLLIKLYRRFDTWRAPFIALLLFIAMYLLSAFVIGPAFRGENPEVTPAAPSPQSQVQPQVDHDSHHR